MTEQNNQHDAAPAMPFGKFRGQWLDRIHNDPAVSGDMFRVLYAITRCLNSKTRAAHPGDLHLAELAHVSVRTVQRAIKNAQARGHLEVTPSHAQRARILRPLVEAGQNVAPAAMAPAQTGHERRHEGRHGFRASAEESSASAYNSRDSQDSPRKVPTSSATVAERPQTTYTSDEVDLVRDTLATFGPSMAIGGIVKCVRKRGNAIDGAAIVNMARDGIFKRDGELISDSAVEDDTKAAAAA